MIGSINSLPLNQLQDTLWSQIKETNDTNITQSELTQFNEKMKNKLGVSMDIESIMEQYDTDNDNGLSEEEFAKILEKSWNEIEPSEVYLRKNEIQEEDIWEKIDADQDGVLGKEEIQNFSDEIKAQYGISIDVEKMMTELDQDSDGKITEDEFNSVMESRMNMADEVSTSSRNHSLSRYMKLPKVMYETQPSEETDMVLEGILESRTEEVANMSSLFNTSANGSTESDDNLMFNLNTMASYLAGQDLLVKNEYY
jgi:Ca2+-binding EF-hand superfamily protein